MSAAPRKALVFVESNTSGTGALFVRVAREMGFRPVLVSANPGRYAFVHAPGAAEGAHGALRVRVDAMARAEAA